MEDLEFIKKFSKITIKKVCELSGVNRSNLMSGKIKDEKKIKKVRKAIESEIAKLYIMEEIDKWKI